MYHAKCLKILLKIMFTKNNTTIFSSNYLDQETECHCKNQQYSNIYHVFP